MGNDHIYVGNNRGRTIDKIDDNEHIMVFYGKLYLFIGPVIPDEMVKSVVYRLFSN